MLTQCKGKKKISQINQIHLYFFLFSTSLSFIFCQLLVMSNLLLAQAALCLLVICSRHFCEI